MLNEQNVVEALDLANWAYVLDHGGVVLQGRHASPHGLMRWRSGDRRRHGRRAVRPHPGRTLAELGASRPDIVGLTADLGKSSGMMTERALDAAAALGARDIGAGVLHVPTVKPFDVAAVVDFAESVIRVVTAENHVVQGGLASQVAEALFDAGLQRRLTRIGL